MGKSVLTPDVLATIPALVAAGKRREELAAQFGCSVGTLQVVCSRNKISLRCPGPRRRRTQQELEQASYMEKKLFPVQAINIKLKVPLANEVLALLAMRAEVEHTTVDVIATRLLETIARENLYNAVIDEAA